MIIFLDIDGVLNGGKSGFSSISEYVEAKKRFNDEFGISFLLPDVNVLPFIYTINEYLRINGEDSIRAVLSSTWRYNENNVGLLNNMLYKKGLNCKEFIIDITDFINDCSTRKDRGNQIKRWVVKHKPNGFVILDDEFSTMLHYGRLYKTETFLGFTDKDSNRFLKHMLRWRVI